MIEDRKADPFMIADPFKNEEWIESMALFLPASLLSEVVIE